MHAPPDHLVPLIARVRAASIAQPSAPWSPVGHHSVGGLTDVGFGRATDLLLVVSHAGRGVFDGITGARVARDPDAANCTWQDFSELEALGIGPLEDQLVRTSGLAGGALPTSTTDRWQIERLMLDWPDESLLLVAPDSWIYEQRPNRSSSFLKLAVESEVRAFGFSPTGRTLLLATSSDLVLYSREPI